MNGRHHDVPASIRPDFDSAFGVERPVTDDRRSDSDHFRAFQIKVPVKRSQAAAQIVSGKPYCASGLKYETIALAGRQKRPLLRGRLLVEDKRAARTHKERRAGVAALAG